MHRTFKKLLNDAKGISEFVIAVNLDIRGFSAFSKKVESPETAMYVKSIYNSIINDYFPNAEFFKSTGDGLFIIIHYEEKNLKNVAQETINKCLNIIKDFNSICKDNPMINFEVPKNMGIGICRGAASRIISGDITLDYSGRVLNQASRLMDLARPSGIVLDGNFVLDLLSDEQRKLFADEKVYLKGIAERKPVNIHYTKKLTKILPSSKEPIDKIGWRKKKWTYTLKEMKSNISGRLAIALPTIPLDPDQIKIKITYPSIIDGEKINNNLALYFEKFSYLLEAENPILCINTSELSNLLEGENVEDDWNFELKIIYPEKWITTNLEDDVSK